MRSKSAILSTVTSILLQVLNIISALIIPRMIIAAYGSDVNGVISSITQFLGYVSLLQAGVGAAFRASLYKPLSDGDKNRLSEIVKAGSNFFKNISYISVAYIVVLMVIYPFFSKNDFSPYYTASLIFVIGISTFSQYFFGFANINLLIADQRIYLYDLVQMGSVLLNILFSYILINAGCSIQFVKLTTSLVFTLRPVLLKIYCDKHYGLIKNCRPESSALSGRRDSMSFSIADYIHNNTDIFILTAFSAFKDISVYSVYSIVNSGLRAFISVFTNIFQSGFGNMIAKKEIKTLEKTMDAYVTISHLICAAVFSTTITFIIPFVECYTKGVNDVNYIRPLFAFLIINAEFLYCLYLPYQSLVLANANFKEAKNGAYIEAVINITLSLILIKPFGLVGIAMGTFCAMLYRNIDYIIFVSRNIIHIPIKKSVIRYVVTLGNYILCVFLSYQLFYNIESRLIHIVLFAGINFILNISVSLIVNYICYRDNMKFIFHRLHIKLG